MLVCQMREIFLLIEGLGVAQILGVNKIKQKKEVRKMPLVPKTAFSMVCLPVAVPLSAQPAVP